MKTLLKKISSVLMLVCIATVFACFAACEVLPSESDHIHVSGGYTKEVSATCTEDGIKGHYACKECGKKFSDENLTNEITDTVIKAKGHSVTFVPAVGKTCTADGNVAYYHCSECEKNFSDANLTSEISNPIIKAGHTYGDRIAEVPKSCTADGVKGHYQCSDCNKYFDENYAEITDLTIPAGHDIAFVSAVDKTCTTDGNIEHYHCFGCNKNYSDKNGTTEIENVIVKAEHVYGAWTAEVPKNCTTDGVKGYYQCSDCDKYFDENDKEITDLTISAGHSMTFFSAVDKTCTADGKVAYYHCSGCDKNYSDEDGTTEIENVIVKAGHNFINGSDCTVCGQPYYSEGLKFTLLSDGTDETYAVSKGTFNEADLVIPGTYNGKAVSEISAEGFMNISKLKNLTISDGVKKIGSSAFKSCSSLRNVVIPNSVTTIVSGAFKECYSITNMTLPRVNSAGLGFIFGASDYTENYRCTGIIRTLVITNQQYINANAFYGCSMLESVTYSSGCNSIGDSAFEGCTNLTSIPGTTGSIGKKAFKGCTSLTSVSFEQTGYYTIGEDAFYGCTSLESVAFQRMCDIGVQAFYKCSALTSVNMPAGDWTYYSIGDYAFADCVALKSITVPNVKSIGLGAFSGCKALEEMTLPFVGGHSTSADRDHLSYIFGQKEDDKFLDMPNLKKIIINGSQNNIADYAFYNCYNLTSITFPDTVTKIGSKAFYGCSGLNSIIISRGVTEIGYNAFYGATRLTAVYYEGSADDYVGLTVNSGNDAITSAIHYYSENEPTEDGNYWHYVDGVPAVWSTESSEG